MRNVKVDRLDKKKSRLTSALECDQKIGSE